MSSLSTDLSDVAVDVATYLSLLVAIVVFVYQEISKAKNRSKESLSFKDEFINMIIRNHINSNLEIAQVDFDIVISGFEKLKSCKLLFSKKDLLEMIYAKVSDNEHIEAQVRINILKQTKAVLTDIDSLENIQDPQTNKWSVLIAPFGASIITLLSMLFASGIIIKEDILPNDPIIIVFIISIFSLIIFKLQPLLNKVIEFLFIKDRENNENIKTHDFTKLLSELDEQLESIQKNVVEQSIAIKEQPPKDNDKKAITLNEYLKDGEKTLRVAELRILLEYKLMEYFDVYFERKQVQKIKPNSFMKTLSLLESEKALTEGEASLYKSLYSYASRIMHASNDIKSDIELSEFIMDSEFVIKHIENKISKLT